MSRQDMDKPIVSVVIPTYNRAGYLREALDSVAAQTFQDLEVVVVDDGSDEDIASSVSGHAARPRLIRQARQGPAAARNRGIFESRGEFIAFLDSDDHWLPNKLAVFVTALQEAKNVNVFYGPMIPVDDAGRTVSGRTKPRYEGWITQRLFESCFVDVPSVVCRKSVLVDAGCFDASLPVCEDYDLWLRISVAEPFGLISEPLAKRRLHDNRLSKQLMSRNLGVKARVLERFYEQHRDGRLLDQRSAAARLSRVYFQAGRAAFHDGAYQQAVEYCRASRAHGRSPFRTILFSAAAATMAMLSGDRKKVAAGAAKV